MIVLNLPEPTRIIQLLVIRCSYSFVAGIIRLIYFIVLNLLEQTRIIHLLDIQCTPSFVASKIQITYSL